MAAINPAYTSYADRFDDASTCPYNDGTRVAPVYAKNLLVDLSRTRQVYEQVGTRFRQNWS